MTLAPPGEVDVGAAAPLSGLLRARTREAHERAESSSFVRDLLGGGLPVDAYTAMVAQNHAIYAELEAVAASWVGHEVAGPFVLSELTRLPALERDLAVLLGPHWRSAAAALVQPATVRYADHLLAVAGRSAAAFVAHHYVRYLGDLSGGQIVARRVGELYGDVVRDARAFYSFPAIAKVVPFREAYRRRLDALDLHLADRDLLLAEAVTAFELNEAVFADLARAHPGPA